MSRFSIPRRLFSTTAACLKDRVQPWQAPTFTTIGTRTIFNEEHDTFRESVRKYLSSNVKPNIPAWEKDKHPSRNFWSGLGEQGLLCLTVPEKYGGPEGDSLFMSIIWDELGYCNAVGLGAAVLVHSDIVAPYILHYGTEEQKNRYIPQMAKGQLVGAIAMSEPGAGSDLQAIRTSAVQDGSDWIINGSKTYITNGWNSDVVIVVALTDKNKKSAHGMSLFLVDKDTPGFTKGQPLVKMGSKYCDTTELFFDNVRVPKSQLLGELNRGFYYLMQELPQERLAIGGVSIAHAEAMFEWTRTHCKERAMFGGHLADKQLTKQKMAELKTEIAVGRAFTDSCILLHQQKKLDATTASMVKYWMSELQGKMGDLAVQLHGGAGYCWDYDVCRGFADGRVQRIYGGSNEVMKELIARTIF